MGRKPKKPKKSETKAKPEKVETERRQATGSQISENDLRNLLRAVKNGENDKDAAVGFIREKIGFAVEKKHLNKKVFALIRKFDKMEAEELADFWDVLGLYMDMAGLTQRMESVAKLPLPEPAEKVEPEASDESVSRPRLAVVNEATDKISA